MIELRERVNRAGALARQRFVAMFAEMHEQREGLDTEHSRVLLARMFVALIPDSLSLIERLLSDSSPDAVRAELQFSLFVALEDLPSMVDGGMLLPSVAPLVQRYLIRVREDPVQAAWMAGDLLGDHWPLDTSLPMLIQVSRTAEFEAGREGAIHGLSHALARANKREQWAIVHALRQVMEQDESEIVRRYAGSVCAGLRGL